MNRSTTVQIILDPDLADIQDITREIIGTRIHRVRTILRMAEIVKVGDHLHQKSFIPDPGHMVISLMNAITKKIQFQGSFILDR